MRSADVRADQAEAAVAEYEKCLALRKKLCSADDRSLGETHFYVGLAHQIAQHPEQALGHYESAVAILEKRLAEAKSISSTASGDAKDLLDAEVAELQLVIEELRGRMEEVTGVEKVDPST